MSRKEKYSFTSKRGDKLSATLDLPAADTRGYAVFAHCFTCSRNIVTTARIAAALARHGIAVLRFDFTGLGDSEGDFADTNLSTNIDDVLSAIEFLREHFDAPALLIGHSLGASAVIAAASRIPDVRAVVTLSAPDDPGHLLQLLKHHLAEIELQGQAAVEIGGQQFTITRQFIDDINKHAGRQQMAQLNKPVLILHAIDDELTSIDHAHRLFEQAKEPKSLVSLHGANHLFSHQDNADIIASIIANWSYPYLVR
jgi:putative redox protein